jgi:hypothetical protein
VSRCSPWSFVSRGAQVLIGGYLRDRLLNRAMCTLIPLAVSSGRCGVGRRARKRSVRGTRLSGRRPVHHAAICSECRLTDDDARVTIEAALHV